MRHNQSSSNIISANQAYVRINLHNCTSFLNKTRGTNIQLALEDASEHKVILDIAMIVPIISKDVTLELGLDTSPFQNLSPSSTRKPIMHAATKQSHPYKQIKPNYRKAANVTNPSGSRMHYKRNIKIQSHLYAPNHYLHKFLQH